MTRKWKLLSLISGIVFLAFVIAGLAMLRYANVIARAGVEKALGKDFTVGSIDLKWGSVRAHNVVMKGKAGREVIRVGAVLVRADFMNLFRKKYNISSLHLEDPYIYVEVDKKGRIVNPGLTLDEKQQVKKEAEKTPVSFEKITVTNGSVDYLDRKTPRVPVLMKVRNINMQMHHLTYPFTDESTRYAISAHVPAGKSTASIRSEGKIKFASQDVDSTSRVRDLDITHFKPYYDRQAKSVHVKKGLMDLDVRTKIVSRKIHAPGHAVLKGLELETSSGFGDRFMGVPASVVLGFMKKSGDRLPVNFVVSGDLDNPRFNVTENFMTTLSFGIAEKLGVSVKDIGESIFGIGAEGTKKVGEGIKEGLKKIFR